MIGMALVKSTSAIPTWTKTVALVREHDALRAIQYSDQDASWGHRSAVSTRKGSGFYGYKIDLAVCTATDLPLAWNVGTAREHEQAHALALIEP